MKNIYFVILALFIMAYMIISIRKNRLSVNTSFGWIIGVIFMLILSIFPKSLDWLATFLDINYPPALFLTLCVIVLIMIDFDYSKKISDLNEKIIDLAQELSILKNNDEKNK